MKLTFIIPPQYDDKRPAERTAGCTRVTYQAPNIYELTVAALLRRDGGHNVTYRDFIYHGYTRNDFAGFLENDDSDAYLMWVVNLSIENDLQALHDIRRIRGNAVPVVLMGPGPTYFTGECINKDPYVVIARGEPDYTVLDLLGKIEQSGVASSVFADVDGISFYDPDARRIVTTRPRKLIADLDALPMPARDLLGGRKFHNPKLKTGPYTTVVTSRNCPYHCIYCVPSSLTFAREIEFRRVAAEEGRRSAGSVKPPIMMRSVENIETEIAALAAEGYKAVGFMDDNFIWNETRTRGICDIMQRYGMVWGCQARVDAITEPIAAMLAEANCRYVDLGIESFNDEILKYIKKGITSDDIYRAIGLLKKYKVPVKLNVLIGSSPLETRETVEDTLRRARKLDVDQVMFNIVSPFPGTEFYNIAKDNGWLAGGCYVPTDVQRESILNLPSLSAREMERLLKRNNLRFFLSPKIIWRHLRRFESPGEFFAAARAMCHKLWGK